MNYGNKIEKLYHKLKSRHGQPEEQWRLWCKRSKTKAERERVLIGAILTQNTNWLNVEKALGNLQRARACSLENLARLGKKRIAPLIKPAGFYKVKSGYVFNLAEFVVKKYGSILAMAKVRTEKLRRELLGIKGIGPETADSILLYGLNKPVFVIDEYTRRLVKALGMAKDLSYDFLQKLFEKNLRKDYRSYQDFHALIVIEGKKF